MNEGFPLQIRLRHEDKEKHNVFPSYSHYKGMSLNKCCSPKLHKRVSAHRKGHIQFSEYLLQMTSTARQVQPLSELPEGILGGQWHPSKAPATLFPHPLKLSLAPALTLSSINDVGITRTVC